MDVENDHNTPIDEFFSHYGHKDGGHYDSDQISQTAQYLKIMLYKHHSQSKSKQNDDKTIASGQFYLNYSNNIDIQHGMISKSNQTMKINCVDQFKNANNLMPICLAITSKHLIFYTLKEGFLQKINLKYFQPSAINLHFWCDINFDIKFQILRENWPDQFTPGVAKGIKFQRPLNNTSNNSTHKLQYQSLQLYSTPEIVQSVLVPLQHRLNQRNFHNLLKAKKKIGKGAFATVYLAERLLDKRMVAVKAFSKEKQFSTKNGKQALINQIKLLRDINHKNILQLLQIYETENSLYMLMDNLEGGQLNQRIKFATKKYAHQLPRQLFSNLQIKMIIKSLLEATSYLNQLGIIHRDLKPENIMFKHPDSFQAVLCDFGLATYANQQNYLFVRCGTPGYVAPQIINIKDMNTKSNPISDVFSVGVIMHLLLFGVSVFPGKKYNDILTQNRACDFDFSNEMYQDYVSNGGVCERQAYQLMKRMLQRNPNQRISADKALMYQYFYDEMLPQFHTKKPSNVMDIEQDVYSDTSKFSSQKCGNSLPKQEIILHVPQGLMKRGSQAVRVQNIILGQDIPLKHFNSSNCNNIFQKESEQKSLGYSFVNKKKQIESPRYIKMQDQSGKYNIEKIMAYSPKNNINGNLFEPFAKENRQNLMYQKQNVNTSVMAPTKKPTQSNGLKKGIQLKPENFR